MSQKILYLNPLTTFKLYLTPQLVRDVTCSTNINHANEHNENIRNSLSTEDELTSTDFSLRLYTAGDINAFIGCQILMGYVPLMEERMYSRKSLKRIQPPLQDVMLYTTWLDLKRQFACPMLAQQYINSEMNGDKWKYLSTSYQFDHPSLYMS